MHSAVQCSRSQGAGGVASPPDPLTPSCPCASLASGHIPARSSEGLEGLLSLHLGLLTLVTGGLGALLGAGF